MKERLIGGIMEEVNMRIKSKLESSIRSGLEKRVQVSDIQKMEVGIEERTPPPFPYIILRQYIRNGSELPLKINRISVVLEVNDRHLDKIDYLNSGTIPAHELNFPREYETTKLNQVIPDFDMHFLKINANVGIELQSPWGVKIQKAVGGEITIKTNEWI